MSPLPPRAGPHARSILLFSFASFDSLDLLFSRVGCSPPFLRTILSPPLSLPSCPRDHTHCIPPPSQERQHGMRRIAASCVSPPSCNGASWSTQMCLYHGPASAAGIMYIHTRARDPFAVRSRIFDAHTQRRPQPPHFILLNTTVLCSSLSSEQTEHDCPLQDPGASTTGRTLCISQTRSPSLTITHTHGSTWCRSHPRTRLSLSSPFPAVSKHAMTGYPCGSRTRLCGGEEQGGRESAYRVAPTPSRLIPTERGR